MKRFSSGVAFVILVVLAGRTSAAIVNATWDGAIGIGGSGNWSDMLRWSGGVVPNNGADTYNVFIDGGKIGASTVTLNVNATIDSLTVDVGDQLTIANGEELTLATGNLINNGTVQIGAINTSTGITFQNSGTISGNGVIALTNNGFNRIHTDGSTLTQNATHTIEGAGQLLANTGDMVNHGTIRQTGSNQLVIDTLGTFVNNGIMEASGSGGIQLLEGSYELGTTTLTVKMSSKLDIEQNVIVRNSRLVTEGNGIVNVNSTEDVAPGISAAQFENVISDALVLQGNTEDSHILGTFENNGTWTLGAINGNTDITFAGGVSIAGTGKIALTNNGFNRILTDGATLTQTVNHTIEGAGQLLANTGDMINHGIISQLGSNQLIIDPLLTFTNDGTLEALGSGGIKLLQGTYELGGTSITVGASSKLDIESHVLLRNAHLITNGNGIVNVNTAETGALNTAQFENLLSDASVLQGNTEDAHILGTFENNGTWTLGAINGNTDITFAGGVSIAGAGKIALTNNGFNRILTDGATLTQTVNHTIEGAGQLLANTGDMINHGIISQLGSNQLIIDPLLTFTNDGTLEALGSGGIKLLQGTYELGGTSITVGASSKLDIESHVLLRNAHLITNGNGIVNVNTAETGALNTAQFENLLSDASVLQGNTEDAHILGTFENNGTWTLGAINGNTDITFAGGVSIAGAGKIALTNNGFNRILTDGATLTQTVNHTIEGAGQLLANTGDMINHGIISQLGSNQLIIDPLLTFTNDGTLEALGSGGIKLLQGTYELGTSTLTVKTGSKLDIEQNVVVRDSRLVSEGSGIVNVNSVEDAAAEISAAQFEDVIVDAAVLQGNSEDAQISGTFTNNKSWSLSGINTNTDVTFAGPVSIAGVGKFLLSNNPFNRILTDGAVLTQGIDHTIEGAGQLLADTGDMVNNGTITQIGSNQLVIDPLATFVNNGTIEATGSGGIKLLEGAYELGTSTLTIKSASKLDVENYVVIRNSRLVSEGSGVVNINSTEDGLAPIRAAQFENATIDATVVQGNSEDARVLGTFTNNGIWNLSAVNTGTDITFADGVNISGSGEIAMSNNPFNRLIVSGGEVVNGALHTIKGAGQLLGGDFRNQGTIMVNATNGLSVTSAAFTNEGIVDISRKLTRTGDYLQSSGLTVVNGELEANVVNLTGGTLMGDGLVDANLLNNGGVVNVGNSPGELDVDGTFVQTGGTFLVEITGNGPGLFDILDISGNATLGGFIDVDLLGYAPFIGESFDVLFAPEIFGNFVNAGGFSADNFIWTAQIIINGIGDDTVRLTAVAPVPVPAALWMLLAPVGWLAAARRRRHA